MGLKMGQDNGRVAIIADKYLAFGFRLAGIIAFPVRDVQEATKAFEKIVAEDKYDVIIMTENLSMVLKKQRAVLAREKQRPVIAVIPDFNGPTGERLRELRTLVTQSVGAELKFEA